MIRVSGLGVLAPLQKIGWASRCDCSAMKSCCWQSSYAHSIDVALIPMDPAEQAQMLQHLWRPEAQSHRRAKNRRDGLLFLHVCAHTARPPAQEEEYFLAPA